MVYTVEPIFSNTIAVITYQYHKLLPITDRLTRLDSGLPIIQDLFQCQSTCTVKQTHSVLALTSLQYHFCLLNL